MIKIHNLQKSFGDKKVLKGIDLTIEDFTVTSIIGASGSGKSTLLRSINLLEKSNGEKFISMNMKLLAKIQT